MLKMQEHFSAVPGWHEYRKKRRSTFSVARLFAFAPEPTLMLIDVHKEHVPQP